MTAILCPRWFFLGEFLRPQKSFPWGGHRQTSSKGKVSVITLLGEFTRLSTCIPSNIGNRSWGFIPLLPGTWMAIVVSLSPTLTSSVLLLYVDVRPPCAQTVFNLGLVSMSASYSGYVMSFMLSLDNFQFIQDLEVLFVQTPRCTSRSSNRTIPEALACFFQIIIAVTISWGSYQP